MGSITSEEKRWSRTDKDWMYSVDLKSKKGSKFKNTLMTSLTPEQAKDIAAVGMEMMRQMGAEKSGNETIDGRDCEVYEVKKMGTKIWVWKNITLKTMVNMGGLKMEITATEVVEGGDIPEEKFNFPEGVDPATLLEMSLPSMK